MNWHERQLLFLKIYHKRIRKNDFYGADIKILHDRSEN